MTLGPASAVVISVVLLIVYLKVCPRVRA